jgi:hypothetical protein
MLAGAESDIEAAKQRQTEMLATGKAEAGERRAAAERPARGDLRNQAVKKSRCQRFVPTKDTVQDVAALFSLIGVIGTGSWRQRPSVILSPLISAMNGMLEGWQKGRSDLYTLPAQRV